MDEIPVGGDLRGLEESYVGVTAPEDASDFHHAGESSAGEERDRIGLCVYRTGVRIHPLDPHSAAVG
jgi:hypothetical protein